MKRFRFSFIVGEQLLTTIISLLSGHIKNMAIQEVEEDPTKAGRIPDGPKVVKKAIPPKDDSPSWVIAKDWLSKIEPGNIITTASLGKALEKGGYNKNSASVLFTHLRRANMISSPEFRGAPVKKL